MKAARVLRFDSPNVITNDDLTQPAPAVGQLLVRDFPPQINNRASALGLGSPRESPAAKSLVMAATQLEPSIDEYLRRRLMPVEGSIPRLAGIDVYGNSVPAGKVGGDLFEYINFQQRYNIDARVARGVQLSRDYMDSKRGGPAKLGGRTCAMAGVQTGIHRFDGHRVQKGEMFRASENC
jgi:hypothetical protein